jgi:class I lanthipeptide synthase
MTTLYQPAPWAVLRTPLLPAGRARQAREPENALQDPVVVRALAIGCPDLLATLHRPTTKGRDLERARTSLARYLLRMTTRPTPYGAFAAVSLVGWGDASTVELGADERIRTRPDMGWLLGLLRTVDADPAARAAASWQTNPLLVEQDGRLSVSGSGSSVRASRAARVAVDSARRPLPYAELRSALQQQTGGTADQVETLLTELWAQRLLLTDLQPTLTGPETCPRIVRLVRRTRPETADALAALLTEMATFDQAPAAEAPDRLVSIGGSMSALHSAEGATTQTDMARLVTGTLNEHVGLECARAAELLLRLTPAPLGSSDLTSYRRSFVAHYGQDAQIPLLELLDQGKGLGPLGHSHAGNLGGDPVRAAERADALMTVALDALRDGRRVVELNGSTVAALQTWQPSATSAPVSIELSAFVVARSAADVDAGDFRLVVGPNLGAPSAGRSLGRFADLLQPTADEMYRWLAAAEGAAAPHQVPVEVVYAPAGARLANVVIRPTTTEHEIVVDCQPGVPRDCVIPLEDLVVGVRDERLYVMSSSLGAEIRPTARHMLNTHNAPAVCQLLDEISRAGTALFTTFNWGPADDLPVLPRLQSGRVVLELARWQFKPRRSARREDRRADLRRFVDELAAFRARWAVPARVYVGTVDNRLLLDLDQESDVEQLHREAATGPGVPLRLYEAMPDLDDAWLPGPHGGYLSEIVVPLVLRPTRATPAVSAAGDGSAAATAPLGIGTPVDQRRPGGALRPATVRDRLRPPGSDWLFAKFYGPREREDELLTGPLADLCGMTEASGLASSWFFLRYADPEPHVRIRWHGDPELLLRQLLPHLSDVAQALVDAGALTRFALDTYERELDRYGGPDGLDVCERIFHADSQAVQPLLALPPASESDLTELTVRSVDSLLAGLGLDPAARLAFYLRQTSSTEDEAARRRAGEDYRARKTRLRTLLGEPATDTGSDLVADILAARATVLADAAADLNRLAAGGRLWSPVGNLYPSLVHMHINRLAGSLDGPTETHLLHLLQRTRHGLQASAR